MMSSAHKDTGSKTLNSSALLAMDSNFSIKILLFLLNMCKNSCRILKWNPGVKIFL